jgi:polysaccharide pyruvyl transferase WcaK-like protein
MPEQPEGPPVAPTAVTRSRGVALAGFYQHGNFGDDLMAVLFGRHLRSLGAPARVFRLCAPYAESCGLPVARSLDELLDGADTLVWGGGGLLVPLDGARFRRMFPGVAEESAALVASARRRGMRLVLLSVGGAGVPPVGLAPEYRAELVARADHITVRNRDDAIQLAALGRSAEYFPDVLWRTATTFPQPHSPRTGLRIGLDLNVHNLRRHQATYWLALIQSLIWLRRDCTFILINTQNASMPGQRKLERCLHGRALQRYRFRHLHEDLQLLASLDLLLSTRLHAALVALAYGVPAISLFAEGKTRLLFSELGLSHLCCGHAQVPWLCRLLASPRRLDDFLAEYPHPHVAALARDSRGHLDRLTELVAPPRPR